MTAAFDCCAGDRKTPSHASTGDLRNLIMVMLGSSWVPTSCFPGSIRQPRSSPLAGVDGLNGMTWRGLTRRAFDVLVWLISRRCLRRWRFDSSGGV
jgi:hypothetical protein